MKFSEEKQESIITEAFDHLKDTFDEDYDAFNGVKDAVGKMAKINTSKAVEMLEYLIVRYPDNLTETSYENDFQLIVFVMSGIAGEEKTYQVITYNDSVRHAFFGECGGVDENIIGAISYVFAKGNFKFADELMKLVISNKNKYGSLDNLIEEAISNIHNWKEEKWKNNDEALAFLLEWTNEVSNTNTQKELCAKAEKLCR